MFGDLIRTWDNGLHDDELIASGTIGGFITNAPVPEPTTMLLFGIGLLGLAGVSRRKKIVQVLKNQL